MVSPFSIAYLMAVLAIRAEEIEESGGQNSAINPGLIHKGPSREGSVMPLSYSPYQQLPVVPFGLPMMPSLKSLVPSIDYVPSRVSRALITNSDAAGQDLTIAQVFTLMDRDKDNYLSADELLMVSKLGNQSSSSDTPSMCQAKMTLRMFDEFAGGNGNGKMDYQEFLTFMDYYSNPEKSDALLKKMMCAIFS